MRSEPDAERSTRARTGSHRGLAYIRVEPGTPPRGGVVILHGAGSRKENHELATQSSFIRVPGGDHGSAQHDPALQVDAVRFLLDRAE